MVPRSEPAARARCSLARPLGTYLNQWAAYELDKIVDAAKANGVAVQLCSCSGPWFTWPADPPTLGAGWASSAFNEAYAGIATSAFNRISLEAWLTAHVTPHAYIGLACKFYPVEADHQHLPGLLP